MAHLDDKDEVQAIKDMELFINNLPYLVKEKSPLITKAIMATSLSASSLSLTYFIGSYDFLTPYSTNACNVFTSFMLHFGIVIGPSSLFALQAINYSVYPQRLNKAMPQNQSKLLNLGRAQSGLHSLVTSNLALSTLPGGLMFLSLSMIDHLSMFYSVPCVLF